MQNFVFYAIVELGAACPLCLHGSAVKIMLCHAQSVNSPFALRVHFGLLIPLKYHNTLHRQKKTAIYYLYYIGYDENNGEN